MQYLSMDCSVTLGEALLNSKSYEQARIQLEHSLDKSERLGLRAQTARIHYLLARSLQASSNSEASAHYKQAVALLDDLRKEDGTTHLLDRADLRSMYADASHAQGGAALAHN